MKENTAQIRRLLVRLEESGSIPKRLMLWRKVISAAHDCHEAELQKMEALNVPVADDILLATYGSPVE